jgi:hypothetical protein
MISDINALISELSPDLQKTYALLDEYTKQLSLHLDPKWITRAMANATDLEGHTERIICYAEHQMTGTPLFKFATTNVPYMILAGHPYETVLPLRAEGDDRVLGTPGEYGLDHLSNDIIRVRLQQMSLDKPHQVLGPPIAISARDFEENDISEEVLKDYPYVGQYRNLF